MTREEVMVVVVKNHDCHAHFGEPVQIGPYQVMAGGIRLSEATLDNTDVLMTLCDQLPPNLGSREVTHRRFSIEDFGVSPYLAVYLKTHILSDLAEERRVTIHCQGGFGRAGMVLGGLIALLEPDIEDPVAEVRKRYCPRAIETPLQEAWVRELRKMALAERQATSNKGVVHMSAPEVTNDEWYMAGTEGTGKYLVIARNKAGKIGIRPFDRTVRIRIEPTDQDSADALAAFFPRSEKWKQPGDNGQNRFSLDLLKGMKTIMTVASALKALKKTGGKLKRQPSLRFGRWLRYTI
jgi:protein-tyrosine phosphatase